jgi:hypothetical protein
MAFFERVDFFGLAELASAGGLSHIDPVVPFVACTLEPLGVYKGLRQVYRMIINGVPVFRYSATI